MSKSEVHLCPVCKGSGEMPLNNSPKHKPCHGCDGKGWVIVWVNYVIKMSDNTKIEG